jgi:nucleoside-diphosphate-sugar epimerase
MGEDRLHVVFGTGQVGRALAACLAGRGLAVRAVSGHRPPGLADGIDWRAADATDLDSASDTAKGAAVVYQCLNAPYTQWPERFPPLQRGVLAAAERSGALLVCLENVYGYGPAGGRPMTEDLPLAATTVKGRTRAAMTAELLAAADAGRVRVAIRRASDFFGPGVTQGLTLGERVFGHALAGRRADFIGHPDLPNTYSYVPDIAAGLATLLTVTAGVGHSKKAARNINAWLREIAPANLPKHKLVSFHELNLWYFGDAARRWYFGNAARRRYFGNAARRRTGAGIGRTDSGGF